MMFREGQRPYVIAEIGANHNGDLALARELIDSAKALGADSAKFQSWDINLFSKKVYEDNYFLSDDYRNRTDYTLKKIVNEFAVTRAELGELAAYCTKAGIDFASTPFAEDQVEPLVTFGAPFVKIASMDVTNDRLLRVAAETSLPVLLSTGMAELGEIDRALAILVQAKAKEIVLLHCVAIYPTPPSELNLRNITMLRNQFGYAVGFSDHSVGVEASIAATALGAVVIEKHFTLNNNMFGWDHKMSADPKTLGDMIKGIQLAHSMLGSDQRRIGPTELLQRQSYRRSVVAARDIRAGEKIGADNTVYRRPGTGLDPSLFHLVNGGTALRDIPYDTMISLNDVVVADRQ
ncbi:MAG: N-acetylneuraminate synthase [Gammaproteobacteria bacterium]|nr:N-acetylneuraminate synthase [Gammaproteobacteria bacterium]